MKYVSSFGKRGVGGLWVEQRVSPMVDVLDLSEDN